MTGATVAWSDQAESDADWRLALRIRQVLALDPDLGPLNLGVEVRSRVVTLSGPVPSDWFRRRAEELVRATNGVRSVRNELMVRDSIPLPDSRLRQTPPLDGDAWPRWIGPLQRRATFLGVSSHSGVPSQAPLVRPPAATSAGSRNEAADVPQAYLASRVEAEPQRRCEAACQAGESDLEFAVRRLLRNNARFSQVKATVVGRTVLLSGTVACAADRDDLVHAVCALEGVEGVEHAKLRVSEP